MAKTKCEKTDGQINRQTGWFKGNKTRISVRRSTQLIFWITVREKTLNISRDQDSFATKLNVNIFNTFKKKIVYKNKQIFRCIFYTQEYCQQVFRQCGESLAQLCTVQRGGVKPIRRCQCQLFCVKWHYDINVIRDKCICTSRRVITFWSLLFNFLNYIVWLRITDEGSVPEMRIWSISLI